MRQMSLLQSNHAFESIKIYFEEDTYIVEELPVGSLIAPVNAEELIKNTSL